jgi:Ca-activated chloride channel family protein
VSLPPAARLVYLGGAAALVLAAVAVALVARRRAAIGRLGVVVLALGLLPLAYEGLAHAELVSEKLLRFGRPEALLLTAAAGGLLAWRLSRLPARMSAARRLLVTTFTSIALFAATFAVAQPELGRRLDRLTVIVAVDRSRSIDLVPNAGPRIAMELQVVERGMHDDDRIGIVAFGAEAATEDPARPRSELPTPQRVEIGRDGTDIEGAVRRALAEIPADTSARIVLVSDGVQTRGDALSAAASAVGADVPIDVVILEQKPVNDVRIVSVRAPAHGDQGEALDLRVVTSSAVATDVEVRVKRDGELVRRGRAHIEAGEDVLRVRETASEPGLHRYDVEVTALDPTADQSPEDNTGSAFVRVRGPALALVVDGDPGKSAPMARALEANGFRVREGAGTSVPTDIGELAAYDLVVLGDVPASDLAVSQVQALASYARDLGGGLVLMGGDRSMGPGGYARTPIEELSPVAFDLKQEKRRASLAEVIAIDYSGSMGMMVSGQTKLALANEAAARSASLLGPGDRLGVEHVDTEVRWTIPLGPVTDVGTIAAKIRGVGVGGGGIYTDIALRAGYEALDREKVNLKHVILFADGDDAEQTAGCRAIVGSAVAHGMTTSVISLGRGHDTPELEVLSKVGGGRFYLIDDATKLPAVFSQETILAAKSAIHEEPFRVAIGAPGPATRAIDFGEAPALGGYVVTEPKARATVLLRGPESDPVLATWAVGIGRASAFTSDFKDRWGARWLGWAGAVKMFGELGRDTARKADDPRVRLESDASGGELHVRADAVGDDGRTQSFRRLTVHVAGPDGFSRDVALEAVGAGRYAASVALARPGVFVATARDEMSGEAVGTTGAVLTAGEELRPTGSDRALLTRMAAMSGGKMRDTLAGLYDDRQSRRFAYTPLTSPLVLVAGLAMVLGVGARRLGVPAVVTRALAAMRARPGQRERQAKALAAAKARAAQQERVNTTLLAAKQRTATHARGSAVAGVMNAGATAVGEQPAFGQPAARGPVPRPASAEPQPRPLTAAERLVQKRRDRR